MPDFFIGLRGGGGVVKHCTRASLQSDRVEDLIRISVEQWFSKWGAHRHCRGGAGHQQKKKRKEKNQ